MAVLYNVSICGYLYWLLGSNVLPADRIRNYRVLVVVLGLKVIGINVSSDNGNRYITVLCAINIRGYLYYLFCLSKANSMTKILNVSPPMVIAWPLLLVYVTTLSVCVVGHYHCTAIA